MPDVYDINGPYAYSLSLPPDAAWTTIVQRDNRTFLVDAKFTLTKDGRHHRYGAFKYGNQKWGPDDFVYNVTLDLAEYSYDGGNTWSVCTPQTYDRKHTAVSPMAATATPTEYDFVWNAFFDLPEDFEGEAILRFTFSSASPPITITSTSFAVVTFVRTSTLIKDQTYTPIFQIDDFLGEGPICPWVRDPQDFRMARGRELIKSCVRMILSTKGATNRWGGELPWKPQFGCLFWTLLHDLGDEITREFAFAHADAAMQFEPRIIITTVRIEYQDRGNSRAMLIRVNYELISQNTEQNRVVLPQPEEVVIEV